MDLGFRVQGLGFRAYGLPEPPKYPKKGSNISQYEVIWGYNTG